MFQSYPSLSAKHSVKQHSEKHDIVFIIYAVLLGVFLFNVMAPPSLCKFYFEMKVSNNDLRLIFDIYFYATFSTIHKVASLKRTCV